MEGMVKMDLGHPELSNFRNIILCGFMGAGKSWAMKRTKKGAPQGLEFVDLDDKILEQSGYNTILKMMRELGEEHFRRVENEILISLLKEGGYFVSAGGGALNRGINFVLEKRNDILVVWLNTPLEQCEKNLEKDHKNVRPLYKDNKENIQEIFEERKKIYEIAQVAINWEEQQELKSYDDFLKLVVKKL